MLSRKRQGEFRSISGRLALLLSSLIFSIGLPIWGWSIYTEYQHRSHLENTLLEEQLALILANHEFYSLSAQYRTISETIWDLRLVDRVAIYNGNCELISRQPLNTTFSGPCGSKEDQVFRYNPTSAINGIKSIVIRKNSIITQGFFAEVLTMGGVIFAICLAFWALSRKLVRKVFDEPVREIVKNILESSKSPTEENLSKEKEHRATPRELRPIKQALTQANVELDKSRKKIISMTRDQAFSTMARQVAHDIRSPLSFLKILAYKPHAIAETSTQKVFVSCVENINQIAEDLLSFSKKQKISEGQLIHQKGLNPLRSSFSTSIQEIDKSITTLVEIFRKKIEHSSSHIKISKTNNCSTEDTRTPVVGEAPQIHRILTNLVQNSVESIDAKGFGFISIEFSKVDDRLLIQVRDSGKGMSSELVKKIGKEEVSQGKQHGNGFGLYSASRMIESWGGSLTVSSQETSGTTIFISLKAKSINKEAPQRKDGTSVRC